MKKILLLLISAICILNISAQANQKYIDEAYSLIKIKSFNASTNSKKCDVYAYLRAGNLGKQVSYYIELKRKATNETIFRDFLNLNDLNASKVVQSFRQKDEIYELFFGLWVIYEDSYLQITVIEPNGNHLIIPVEYTDYKNPITIMN